MGWWGWGGTARHNTPSMVTCTSFVLGFVAICFVWSSPSLFKKITHHLIISPKLAKNIPELFTLITFKINTEGEISRLGKYSYLLLLHFEYMPKLANDEMMVLTDLLLLVSEMYRVRICGAVALSL